MAEESNNSGNSGVRPCKQIGEGEDDELSMIDVLNEQARLMADANAVLGGSDEKNCTYPMGYIKRQALYACATCTPEGNAGICLACSYACHEGHQLYELYTKRHFTCDCGNEKFGGKECKLYKEKKGLNASNRYNQNFRGVYCSCARPYPDPEDNEEDEMIQCIMCEDWYHGRHLKAAVPDSDDFHEMICPACMSKYSFLWAYYVPRPVKQADDPGSVEEDIVDICDSSETKNPGLDITDTTEACQQVSSVKDEKVDIQSENIQDMTNRQQDAHLSPGVKREWEANGSAGVGLEGEALSPKRIKLEASEKEQAKKEDMATKEENDTSDKCILKSLQRRYIDSPDCAAFWTDGWRSKLCRCVDCLQMYKDREIEFLVDESDTVHAYEEKGRGSASNMEDEESAASALAGMDRVQQIEIVRGFMDLKTELNEFLHGFAQCGKVVTEKDIREFFQRMEQRRKDRMHVSQFSCR